MGSSAAAAPALARRLGTGDAVLVGLGAMLGAGVFTAFSAGAATAGRDLLWALAAAAVVAFCNAISSAQLAVQYPTSGGTYVYGREQLGAWWGFAAGWCFVIGKTASCAAMALTFATYAVPASGWATRVAAVAAVLALAGVNLRGITRTAALNRVLVAVTLAVLVLVVAAIGSSGQLSAGALLRDGPRAHGVGGLLQSAALLFFAFAGYARIATLGEEVRDPGRTIPRAITVALGVVVITYAVIASTLLAAVGPVALAAMDAPLAETARAVGSSWVTPLVRLGAAVASLGALLALIAGVGRTSLAMARNGDLPRRLAGISPRTSVPQDAEITVAVAVTCLVLLLDVRDVIAFSSFGVLLYYAVANVSALSQAGAHRRWPRAVNVLGLVGCLALVLSLPATTLVAGLAVLLAGLAGRTVAHRSLKPRS